ncbi:MAG: precorrin-6y C5,15-methyltransferase (decarboxylating) subunit CbiE [Treponema sp.]|jgi:precorrin-6Y C5,15-methyltransferase (decarboxylating)|nr:precorrin-6y C5,15-methyltransferase (decarboxylating) subunit CbiE [Treponema sp.]
MNTKAAGKTPAETGTGKKIYLIGTGPGKLSLLTGQARDAIAESHCLIGSGRLLSAVEELIADKPREALTSPEEIFRFITASAYPVLGVLFSGDAGFYSGAKPLIRLLREAGCPFTVAGGLSSLSYFAGRLGRSWDDIQVISLHGRQQEITGPVAHHQNTFFLTDAKMNPAVICAALDKDGFGDCAVTVGERLSYDNERITSGLVREFAEMSFDPLSVMLVENPKPRSCSAGNHGLSDDEFIRAGVPMTKEAVRTLSVSKLALENSDTVWDIGAGTGSVSCEIALRVRRVYAVEKDPAAIPLLEEHKKKFGLYNLEIIHGSAPEAVVDLPKPDRVFIGGAGGALEEIIRVVLEKNPRVTLVVNALTLETLGLLSPLLSDPRFTHTEILQVAVTRAEKAGPYHLMRAWNPVYIFSGQGLCPGSAGGHNDDR